MSTVRLPRVSIGLPLYNGANYVREAVRTILGQTYQNIELIISDNDSTDGSLEISEEIAAVDSRVRVYRNQHNIGAAANYNRVFELATGKYFKWAAHDDVLAPTFVERAVEVLESMPDVVLCSARTRRLDPTGAITGSYGADARWDSAVPARRFHSLVFTPHACVAVFGLVRREVLARTGLIGSYVNSDRVLLAELGLHGRVHEIDQDLFFRRDHPGSSLRRYSDYRDRVRWFDPAKSPRFAFPEWHLLLGYARSVMHAPLDAYTRMRCGLTVASLMLASWRPLLADVKYAAVGVTVKNHATDGVVS